MASPLKDMFRKRGTPLRSPPPEVPESIDEEASLHFHDISTTAMQLLKPVDYLVDVAAGSSPTIFATASGMAVRSMRMWDVKMGPVKKHMVGGHLVPTFTSAVNFLVRKKRRVSIEVRCPAVEADVSAGGSSSQIKEGGVEGEGETATVDGEFKLADDEILFLRVFKRVKAGAHEDNLEDGADDVSIAGSESSDVLSDEASEWREHRSYRLEDALIHKANGRILELKTGSGSDMIVRDVKFSTIKDAESFRSIRAKMLGLEQDRTMTQIARYKDNKQHVPSISSASRELYMSGTSKENINVLVEIVSATKLPVADVSSTDPYVIVRMGGLEIHRTSVISHTLDPIWTLKSGSLFIISMPPEQFFKASAGMSLIVKDFDAIGKNELLGSANVSLDQLLNGTGERMELKIIPDAASEKDSASNKGRLYLRIRDATDDDIKFLAAYQEQGKSDKVGAYIEETFLPIRPPHSKLVKRQTRRGTHGEQLHRVKPFPDPACEEETTWMTKEQIIDESMKPSTHWIEAGSGDLAKLYIEVLGCSGLPNMDRMTTNFLDKTDAFACLVFEDAIVNTDVIGDSLSPRWPPWSHRAFAFNVSHPSSSLMLGVFDYDPEVSPLQLISRATGGGDLHDPIGRIKIHLSNFKANTVYTTAYPLYFGETAEQRKEQRGTIWLRFRIDWAQPKKIVLAAAMPPPPNVVSVTRNIDFQVAHYTIEGPYDEKEFNLTTLTGHIEELYTYDKVLDIVNEAALTVLLWRGHYRVKLGNKEIRLPLHSLTAFLWGILVTWNFNTFPSFVLFSIGWAFLACNESINQNPSPWHKCTPYNPAVLSLLVCEKVYRQGVEIAPNQDLEEIEAYNEKLEKRKRRLQEEKDLEEKQNEELRLEIGEDIEQVEAGGDVDIATKKGGILKKLNVNPLKPILHPIQLQLGDLVIWGRLIKSVVMWENSFLSFWITTLAFVGSIAIIWIPFGFLLRWAMRIMAWVVLGPWMALVDRYKFRDHPDMTDEEKDALFRERLRTRYEEVHKAASHYQVRKERAEKLKSMKKYMFGKWLLTVPGLNEDLYKDTPLPQSFAVPYDELSAEPVQIAQRIYGQTLSGDMIPKREIQAGQVEKQKRRKSLRKGSSKRGVATTAEKIFSGVATTAEKTPLLGRLRGKPRYGGSCLGGNQEVYAGEKSEKNGA